MQGERIKMNQIDDYGIIETKKMIVKHMIKTYGISEQEALINLKYTIIRIQKMFPELSYKEILTILYMGICVE